MKNIVLLLCFARIAYAMKNADNPVFSITYHGTIINLNKGPIVTANGEVDIIFVGYNEQDQLKQALPSSYYQRAGHADRLTHQLFEKHEDDESCSDDDTYKPFNIDERNKKQLWAKARLHNMKTHVINIIEPRIYQNIINNKENNFHYHTRRSILIHEVERVHRPDDDTFSYTCEAHGNKAIIEAAYDLKKCYSAALYEGKLRSKKSIALPTFSTDFGFPREKAAPIAVERILYFIKNHPNTHNRIELFVKKRSEVKHYRKLLIQTFATNASLFSYAINNNQDILLPKEIVLYIQLLMVKA